jgi:hypothetical protein
MKKELGDAKHFQSEAKRELSQLKGVEIMALKNVSSDKVELKFEIIVSGGFHDKDGTNIIIISAVKIGEEWKFPGNLAGYETNWDNSGDVVTFAK